MKEMTIRGVKRPIDTEGLSPDEIHASPLITWITAADAYDYCKREKLTTYIVCVGPSFGIGQFLIVLGQNSSINMGTCALQAIDVFFKCFCVFNICVPATLKPIHDFFTIKLYQTQTHSSRRCVNELVNALNDSDKAEEVTPNFIKL